MGAGHVETSADKAAEDKRDIYRPLEQPFRFVPLVYESHGRACVETQEFLFQSAIAAAKRFLGFGSTESTEVSPDFVKVRNGFLGRWSKAISVAIQRSNAKMIVYGRAAALDLGPAGFLAEEYMWMSFRSWFSSLMN